MSLFGKVVVVTGASSGIGEAIAQTLAGRGCKVVLAARRVENLEQLKTKIMRSKGQCIVVQTDVCKREEVKALLHTAEKEYGPIDILINNAGVMPLSFMKNCHEDEWERMIDVNVKGVLNCIAAVLPGMLERNSGDIVNISSDAGRKVFPSGAVYCATKWAVEAITQGLRLETAGTKLRIVSIQPGATKTELINTITDEEVKDMLAKGTMHLLDAQDVANSVVHALSQPPHCSVNEVLIRPTDQRS